MSGNCSDCGRSDFNTSSGSDEVPSLKDFRNSKLLDKILSKNKKIDFTNFLMILIQMKYSVHSILKNLNWAEFDTIDDFKNSKN